MSADLESSVRPLAWWTDDQLADVARQVELVLSRWCAEWLVPARAAQGANACRAHESADAIGLKWTPFGRGAWTTEPQDAAQALHRAMFASADGTGEMASALARRAWDGLLQELRSTLALDAQPCESPRAADFLPWSGSVVVRLPGIGGLHLLLDRTCMAQMMSAAPPAKPQPVSRAQAMVPVLDALQMQRMSLSVEISGVELPLGTLQGLHVGDVIALDHALDAPLFVRHAGGQVVCRAFLGRKGNNKAIEIAPAESSFQATTHD